MIRLKIGKQVSFAIILTMLMVVFINLLCPGIFWAFKYSILLVSLSGGLTLFLLNIGNFNKERQDLLIATLLIITLFLFGRFGESYNRGDMLQELGSFLVLCNFLTLLLSFDILAFAMKQIKIILWIIAIYASAFILYYYFHPSINNNTIASFSFLLFIYVMILLSIYETHWLCYISTVILFISFAFFLQSRSVLIGELFFITILAFKHLFWKEIVFKFSIVSLLFGSIVFVYFWVWCYNNFIDFKIPFIHKSLYTGREIIWNAFLSLFYQSPFLGIGWGTLIDEAHTEFTGFSPHNFMLSILVPYGCFSFILTIYILLRIFFSKYSIIRKNNSAQIAGSGLMAVLLSSFFETQPISYIHAILVWFLLVIINSIYTARKTICG